MHLMVFAALYLAVHLALPDCARLYLAVPGSALVCHDLPFHRLPHTATGWPKCFCIYRVKCSKAMSWDGMGWGWDRLLVLVDGMEIGNIFVCLIPCYHKHESGKPKWICWFSCTKNDVSLTTLLSFSSPWASLLPLARQTLQCRLTLLRAEAWKEGVLKKK